MPTSFVPAHRLVVSDPIFTTTTITPSALLWREPIASNQISTTDKETYGKPSHPTTLRIGNGGAGYTGILRTLCSAYLASHPHVRSRIGWVSNHSRHSLIALLGDIVDIALTYEPENEALAVREGWARKLGVVFWDHFLLVGPVSNPANLESDCTAAKALTQIIRAGEKGKAVFHSRGDGSATFSKELELFASAGLKSSGDVKDTDSICTFPCTPYEALERASKENAYLVTDRGTFLTAQRDGKIGNLVVYVEGGQELLNPCSAMVKPGNAEAEEFGDWLCGVEAQGIVEGFGREWEWARARGKALFTTTDKEEFGQTEKIVGLRFDGKEKRARESKI